MGYLSFKKPLTFRNGRDGMKLSGDIISAASISRMNDWLDARPYENFQFFFAEKDDAFSHEAAAFIDSNPRLKEMVPEGAYVVTRCVKTQGRKVALVPHFDNYRSTILIPLCVPEHDANSDILIWENARKAPDGLFRHIVTKVWFQIIIANLFLNPVLDNFSRTTVQVGETLTFDGFVNFHCNMHVDGERRSILIHFDKPFSNSGIVRMLERVSQWWAGA